MSQRGYDEVLRDVRIQLARRGTVSLQELARCFRINDRDGSGRFDKDEFTLVLSHAKVFLKKQEISMVFRRFDKDRSGCISYDEFVAELGGLFTGRRVAIAKLAFDQFDKDDNGYIDVKDIRGTFDASRHPKVVSGELSEDQVVREFLKQFENVGGNDSKSDGKVTREEFMEYMKNLSANFPDSDDKFVMMVERAWKVREQPDTGIDANTLAKVLDKVRAQAARRATRNSYPRDTLRLMLKHYDMDGSGNLSYSEFFKALEALGVYLEDSIGQALFKKFDKNGNGSVCYTEFVSATYDGNEPDFRKSLIARSVGTQNADKRPVVIFVLGGPGAGKGTQCSMLSSEFKFDHISTGDLLRAERKRADSPNGQLINKIIQEGGLVPADIVVKLVKARIESSVKKSGTKYFLLDGFPRNEDNVKTWAKVMGNSTRDNNMLYFKCTQENMMRRLIGRSKTSGRSDDNVKSIKKRFATYEQKTKPILEMYRRTNFFEIDANDARDSVYTKAKTAVRSIMAKLGDVY